MFIVNVEGAICRDDKWLVITRSTKEEHAGGTLSLVGGKVPPSSSLDKREYKKSSIMNIEPII
ncbi:hypothetical protein AMQ84_25905 [Paenibacillus riograndensis]|uniref:Nudix hydrolase domain-containing protein n=1 Tax=Paenibacillus riograndensis TaxID=483937 RepID=A0A132TLF5_9BACL|nr:hypothetical protein AMQ84_25905 [Paenibacillus riograndensis]KWX86822.1 hypothetical protein AMQ83_16745 [Paenibacillus riograndensis]